ncbi:MAG: LacI family DNA-binding transcriptional regulator [Fimbriimonas sp.]|nr:LacI family DNA-binding transcriptional regulator [Fimbriimonas sp.]
MRATVSDIARITGLSVGTISRALDTTGRYRINKETRQRVRDVAKSVGYRPNLIGRALVAGSTKQVALVSRAPFTEYYTQLASRFATYVARDGYHVVSNLAEQLVGQEGLPDLLAQDWLFSVDGFLLCDPSRWRDEFIQHAIDLQIPVVGLGAVGWSGADSVRLDIHTPSIDLLEHVISYGRKAIVMVTDEGSYAESRGDAFRTVMSAHNLEARIRKIEHHDRASGRQAALDEIAEFGPPEMFFCVNDAVAIGCACGIAEAGLRVPEDVGIAGCDGIEASEFLPCPLTTIVQPYSEACAKAWEFLKSRIDGYDGPHREVTLGARLALRKSTAFQRAV